ncbi:hypothetical protein EYV94_02710 [Puteibacter caeruleilacunae]|nr:hypothetical protein EYV94_02710 [Puteibacter caeruleilacunae]
MKSKVLIVIIGLISQFALFSRISYSQSRDLVELNNVFIGKGNGLMDSKVSFNKIDVIVNIPQRLKERKFISHGLEYGQINIHYDLTPAIYSPTEVENFNILSYKFTYMNFRSNKLPYMIIVSPTLASNFEGSINLKDFRFLGMFAFIKRYKPGKILTYGVAYSNTFGFPAPMPVINYQVSPTPKWQFNLGFPQLNIQHNVSSKTTLQTGLAITGQNLTLGRDLESINGDGSSSTVPIDNLRINNWAGQVKWIQQIGDYTKFSIGTGYTFRRSFSFNKGSDEKRKFNLDNNIYIQASLKFGFYKKR